jgi:hypothetical protein
VTSEQPPDRIRPDDTEVVPPKARDSGGTGSVRSGTAAWAANEDGQGRHGGRPSRDERTWRHRLRPVRNGGVGRAVGRMRRNEDDHCFLGGLADCVSPARDAAWGHGWTCPRSPTAGPVSPRACASPAPTESGRRAFRDRLHGWAPPLSGRSCHPPADAFHLAEARPVSRRPICAHAGSSAFLLLAGHFASGVIGRMDAVLEITRGSTLAGRHEVRLAKGFLGHPAPERRKLRGEVAVCPGEPGSRRSGRRSG